MKQSLLKLQTEIEKLSKKGISRRDIFNLFLGDYTEREITLALKKVEDAKRSERVG